MDSRPGDVEIGAHKGIVGGDLVADFLFEILGDIGDHRGVDAMVISRQGNVLNDQCLDGWVAGPLPQTKKGGVGGTTAIKPGGGGVDQGLVEIVMAVPF